MPLENTELFGLGAVAIATPIIVEHLKPLLRALPGFRGVDPPWSLVADVVAVLLALWLYYSGTLETATTPVEAALAGFLAALLSQQGYDVSRGTRDRVQATREALRTAGERSSRYDGVVVEEA